MSNHLLRAYSAGVVLGVFGALVLAIWQSAGVRPPTAGGDAASRVAAIRAGASDSFLLAALRDEDADVRLVAVQHLRWHPALVEALGDSHAGVRREAAERLAWIGAPAVPAVAEALRHKDARVRAAAALALRDFSKEGRERPPEEERLIVPLLCDCLKDADVEVRRNAVRGLRRYPWTTEEARSVAVPACREALRDEDSVVREWAELALQRHNERTEEGR